MLLIGQLAKVRKHNSSNFLTCLCIFAALPRQQGPQVEFTHSKRKFSDTNVQHCLMFMAHTNFHACSSGLLTTYKSCAFCAWEFHSSESNSPPLKKLPLHKCSTVQHQQSMTLFPANFADRSAGQGEKT